MRINRQTYEEYFLLYADGELTNTEKLEVEEFINQNPDLGEELEMITQTVMIPDETIVFANKEILLKEEGNRKVIAMRWMRFAAAAAVLVVLMGAGWIFLKDDIKKAPPVAVIEPQKVPVIDQSKEVAPRVIENKEAVIVVKPSSKKTTSVAPVEKNKPIETKSEPQHDVETKGDEEPVENNIPEAALPANDVAFNEPATEPIDIQVEPRKMVHEDLGTSTNNVHYAQALAEEQEKGDQIYFANTQLPKKTKLRGVLRKASRYLERVTSIQ